MYTVNKNFGFELPKWTVSKIQQKFRVFTPKFLMFTPKFRIFNFPSKLQFNAQNLSFFTRLVEPKFRGELPKLRVNNPGYLATETLSSTKIYEIPAEDSEERKPGKFTKFQWNKLLCNRSSEPN
jgi:hypothetical protein